MRDHTPNDNAVVIDLTVQVLVLVGEFRFFTGVIRPSPLETNTVVFALYRRVPGACQL